MCLCALLVGLRGHHVGPDWPGVQVGGGRVPSGLELRLQESAEPVLSQLIWVGKIDPDMKVNEQTHTW